MCTLSWLRRNDSYEVFFNRDELNTRAPERPPEMRNSRGVRYIAPLDGDSGGTWIAANEYGLTLCLVNFYPDQTPVASRDYQSRGLILPLLMSCLDLTDLEHTIRSMSFSSFRPLRLAGFAPVMPVWMGVWDGKEWRINTQANDHEPVVSSSFQTRDVEQFRRDYFRKMLGEFQKVDENMLEMFHRSRHPEQSAYSVCMQRPDAQTVSFCRVKINPFVVRFIYEPDPLNPESRKTSHIWDMNIQTKKQGTFA